jgi:hypothetical protein
MPDFNAVRLNTSVTCISGQYSLAGVLSPKNDKGEVDMTRKLMVFVKCGEMTEALRKAAGIRLEVADEPA